MMISAQKCLYNFCQQEIVKAENDKLREETAKRKQEDENITESEAKRQKESRLSLMAKCNEELKCAVCDELFISVRISVNKPKRFPWLKFSNCRPYSCGICSQAINDVNI